MTKDLPLEFKFEIGATKYIAIKSDQVEGYDIYCNGSILNTVLTEDVLMFTSDKGHWKIIEIVQPAKEVSEQSTPTYSLLETIKAFTQATDASVVIQKNGYEIYVPDFIEGFLAESIEDLIKVMDAVKVLRKALHGDKA